MVYKRHAGSVRLSYTFVPVKIQCYYSAYISVYFVQVFYLHVARPNS